MGGNPRPSREQCAHVSTSFILRQHNCFLFLYNTSGVLLELTPRSRAPFAQVALLAPHKSHLALHVGEAGC